MSDNDKENLINEFSKVSVSNRRITRSVSKLLTIHKTNNNIDTEFQIPTDVKIKRQNTKVVSKINHQSTKKNDLTPNIESEHIDFKNAQPQKSLHLNNFTNVVGRKEEIKFISEFIEDKFKNNESGNLYISGVPGTGKTAIVSEILENLEKSKKCIHKSVNCMNYSTGSRIISQVATSFGVENTKIEDYLAERKGLPIVLVMDEIDQLITKDQYILYRIFDWAAITSKFSIEEESKTSFILIGISNKLNLIEGNLPRLKMHSHPPAQLRVKPYNCDELRKIVLDRLGDEIELNKEQNSALMLCCKKVEKSGDARKVLELYRRGAVLARYDEQPKTPLTPTKSNSELLPTTPFSTPKLLNKKSGSYPSITSSPSIKNIQKAFSLTQTASDPFSNIIDTKTGQVSLPLHQKLVLCSALTLINTNNAVQLKRSKSRIGGKVGSQMTFGQVYDRYTSICGYLEVNCLDSSEILNACDLLDTRGLAKLGKHKDTRSRTFNLGLDRDGIKNALADDAQIMDLMASDNFKNL